MKYRRLHIQELEAVKNEFVQFLASNSIEARDWEALKKNNSEKAEGLLDIFSDIFWEKALGKIRALEIRKSHILRVFHIGEHQVDVIELRLPATSGIDLTDNTDLKAIAGGTIDIASHQPEMFTGSKEYQSSKEMEVFRILEEGATPCDEKLFYGLQVMISNQSE